jgi:hypothetical protein
MLGKLLCYLGVHDFKFHGANKDEYENMRSVWHSCTRCMTTCQFDN